MELTRSQQQYILDVLAELCSRNKGVKLTFTLKPEDQEDSLDSQNEQNLNAENQAAGL